MKVDFITKMGSDLTVANAARVSFDKTSEWDIAGYHEEEYDEESRTSYKHPILSLKDKDIGLINFLARENHWTPFGHCSLQFRIKAPIFVARQLAKHQVGLVWNEVSRRYVDSEPEFYFPEKWRKKNPDKKQGSYENEFVELDFSEKLSTKSIANLTKDHYNYLLDSGVCAEQARMILPQNMYTEWYWSGTLFAFARVCRLRTKKDTQKETRDIADQIHNLTEQHFPVSWKALMCKD
jgi:thymidylate synthase (FAD)